MLRKQREELEKQASRLKSKRVGMNAFLSETAVIRERGAVSSIFIEDPGLALEALVSVPEESKKEFCMVKFRQSVQVPELCELVESIPGRCLSKMGRLGTFPARPVGTWLYFCALTCASLRDKVVHFDLGSHHVICHVSSL